MGSAVPSAAEPVTVIAEDDVGLVATTLDIHRDHPAGPLLATIGLAGDDRRRRGTLVLDAAARGAAPGDLLAVVANATDRGTLTLAQATGSAALQSYVHLRRIEHEGQGGIGALQRGDAGIRPHALQVRLAIWRAGRGVGLCERGGRREDCAQKNETGVRRFHAGLR